DHAFDAKKYSKALSLYENALRHADTNTVPRIYHKMAWCYFRLRSHAQAVDAMKRAITAANKSGEKFLSLKEEALRDMAIFMVESGKVEEAIAYFQGVAGDKNYYAKALERLGKQYERNVETAKAVAVYETLLKTRPESEAAFRVLVKLVELDLKRERYSDALAHLKDFKKPQSNEVETETSYKNLRALIRRTATEHHEIYRKKNAKQDLEIAERFYLGYLTIFLSKDDPRNETPEVKMYLADVKREMGKSKEASELYRQVIETRDKRYAKEAGVLWTASLSEALKKANISKNSDDPSSLEREFVDAADQMQGSLSETNEGREAAMKAALVLAGYKNTQKDAIDRSRKLIAQAPKTVQGLTLAKLWLQITSDRVSPGKPESARDADQLFEVIRELRANVALLAYDHEQGGKLKAQLIEKDKILKIGLIAKNEKDKNFAGAGKGYESFALDSSDKVIAEKAFASSMSSYLKAEDSDGMLRVAAVWLKRYPKSSNAIDSIRSGATIALIQGHFEQSSKLFERLGKEASDEGSLITAAKLSEASGDRAHSEGLYSNYLSLYPKSSERWSVVLMLAQMKVADKSTSEAVQLYEKCIVGSADLKSECASRLADLYALEGDLEHARALFKKAAAKGANGAKGDLSPFVGYARYRLGYLAETQVRFAPMQMPEKQLKAALNQRLDFLEPLSRAYSSAVEAGGPWGVASLNRLATWAVNFADEVDQIPPASGASPEKIKEFRKNLRSVSDPLRQKGIATWIDAFRKGSADEALSPVLPEISDRLSDARVSAYFRAQGSSGHFLLAGIPADGGSDGGDAIKKIREKLLKNAQDSQAWVDYGNLLWGNRKPLLSKIAYRQAMRLNSKNPAALNNSAVVLLSSDGEEDWFVAATGNQLLREALRLDPGFGAAKYNRAMLLNYYRLFGRARAHWEHLSGSMSKLADVHLGMAIALQGTGQLSSAEVEFKKAVELGASKSKFPYAYHLAARSSVHGKKGADQCFSELSDLSGGDLVGFEKAAFDYLKGKCNLWKEKN
ncbi:MAG: hypothetical protein AABZ55_09850, partial [Bdellovibrionota bacterium]